MLKNMNDCGRVLSESDIRGIEASLNIRLPAEYCEFLLTYNGGIPEPRAFPIRGLANNPFGVVQEFLGIDCPIVSSNLRWTYEAMKQRLPSNLFAIARDDGGDLICLSLFGADSDSVVFWDIHQEDTSPTYGNVYYVASSFTEFLAGLRMLPSQ
jgi:hypothetical protein